MTSKRPYLFRAMYEWILDNNLTPHVVVDARLPDVQVPPQYVEDNQITLNLAASAVVGFAMNNQALEFKARFGGRLLHVYVPMAAIIAIYALENNHCLVFGAGEIQKGLLVNMEEGDGGSEGGGGNQGSPERQKGPPKLRIVS